MAGSFFNRPHSAPGEPGENEKIDKKSYLPAYVQLANILKQRISSGIYQPGNRLPSEASLAKHFGLSAMTARQAVSVLAEEGWSNGSRAVAPLSSASVWPPVTLVLAPCAMS
jgi:GntR family transcriptional regulator